MRIEHLLVFCAFFHNVIGRNDEDTQKFIRQRLLPALRKIDVQNVDFDRLHLCHCSSEVGCHARTTGWVPALGEELTFAERKLYENTCYTDGNCYQTARPAPEIPLFGCMDIKSVNDQTEFHDTAARVCTNDTLGTHHSIWICCDEGDFCANQTIIFVPPIPTPISIGWIIPSVLIFCCFVAILVLLLFFVRNSWNKKWQWYTRHKATNGEDVENIVVAAPPPANDPPNNTMSTLVDDAPPNLPPNAIKMLMALEETSGSGTGPTMLHESTIGRQITLMGKIGAGRFGCVSRGIYKGEPVAVKVFKSTDEAAYYKEVTIYETTMLRHPNVLRYIGSDRIALIPDKGHLTELWLVTEYHPSGSLHDFLGENVISLETWFNLIRSAASGLAFLHCAVGGNSNSSKPAIAHRDVKSRNIMVRNDLTCAIGDLGLSLSLNNTTSRVDCPTNAKCGTVRYLAPEILDNTMQTSVFESYLMADVYAFSLVMWEALCRCEEDDVTARDPDDVIPYSEWTERDPTDEQMYEVLCVRKLRPTENPAWKKHPEMRHVIELINTSWNVNPTARFTALQVRMRLERRQMEMRSNANGGQSQAAATASRETTPRRNSKPQKEYEMVPLANRGTTKIHDTEIVENRNGTYKGKDEMKDPLLG